MDPPSSRFQRALTDAVAEARAEKLKALVTTVTMANATFENVKQQAGEIAAYDRVADMMQEIEQKLNAEAKG